MSWSNRFSLLLIAVCAMSGPLHAGGMSYTLTRFDDPAPDGCLPTDCSLREAVIDSAVDPQYDEILLPAGTYHIGAPALALGGGIRLYGAGIDLTLIEGDGGDDLMTYSSPQQMSLQDLSLDAGGQRELVADGADQVGLFRIGAPNPAGMIDIDGSGSNEFGIVESKAIAEVSCSGVGSCFFYDSTLQRIRVSGGGMSGGGDTRVDIQDVIIDGGFSPGDVSGLSVDTSADLRISNTTIRNTTNGAHLTDSPLISQGDVQIDHLHYLDNERPMELGQRASVDITDSEFNGNHHDDPGDPRPGALWVESLSTAVLIERSAFIDNRGSADAGGAVLVEGGASLVARNTTFAGNSFSVAAAGQPGGVRGAAIGYRSSGDTTSITLRHVTIVPPFALPAGISGTTLGGYGGEDGLVIFVLNSILQGSCRLDTDAMDLAIGNIESANNTCDFLSGSSNQVNVPASAIALSTLGMHGGHTPTYVPATTSVAVDAAAPGNCLDEDQRSYARPLGAGCDIGAVEAGDVIFAYGMD